MRYLSILLATSFALGCQPAETTVTGVVTVDGKPLRQGHITFYPVEGTAATRGAEVRDGKYEARAMLTGRFRAVVSQPPAMAVGRTDDGAPLLKHLPMARPIGPDTVGNQIIVEIIPGKQNHDVALTTESGRPR